MREEVGGEVIAVVEEHVEEHLDDWLPKLDRRVALRLMGMSAAALVAGCGNGATTSTAASGEISTTVLTASSATVEQGTNLTLSAVVSPSAATGSVTFYDASTLLGSATLASGTASLSTTFSTTGSQVLTAVYAGNATYAASTSAEVTVTVAAAATCSVTLEGEEGPFFVDDSASGYDRSNILSNLDGTGTQTGVLLALTVYVFDTEKNCAAMEGVQVDIWNCNAAGVYSAESSESTTGETWLRGYQLTDSSGKVAFGTIIPGWYPGRTTHIHMRLRSTYDETETSGSNTMQFFFDQTLIDTLSTSVAPYSTEGTNPTTNATDRVYATQENGTTLLTLTGSVANGYAATVNVYLPI